MPYGGPDAMSDKYTAAEIAAAGLKALADRDAGAAEAARLKAIQDAADADAAAKKKRDDDAAAAIAAAKLKAQQESDDEELGEPGKKALKEERKLRRDAELRAVTAETEVTRLTGELKARDDAKAKADAEAQTKSLKDLRAKVAKEHNLPDDIAERLVGATEAELKADAKKLEGVVKAPTAANTEVGNNGQGAQGQQQQAQAKPAKTFAFMPAGGVPIPD